MTDDAKFGPPALTFDDVLLLPAHSQLMPSEADTTARLTRRIKLADAAAVLGHGHGHRGNHGGGDGPAGRYRRAAPQYVH